jgi:hypothetical protein
VKGIVASVVALIAGVAVSVPSGHTRAEFGVPTSGLEAVWTNTGVKQSEVCHVWNTDDAYRDWLTGWLAWKLEEDTYTKVTRKQVRQFMEGKCNGYTGTEVGA